jgi:hypothetical protein
MNPTIAFENAADELTYALTLGPLPDGPEWEVIESGVEDDKAWTIIEIDGHRFTVTVEPEAQLSRYDIGHGIPGRNQ